MFKEKSIAILIAMMFALLVPATWVWAAAPPPPSPASVGTPTPMPQRKANAPTGAGQNCIASIGPGVYNFYGYVNGVRHDIYFAGVIYVKMADGTVVQAFCIDLLHDTSPGDCYTAGENPELHVNWLMNNYPPDDKLTNEENGARQAAVWNFSDGFTMTAASNIFTRTSEIIAAVPANPTPNPDVPQLSISPSSVNLDNGQPYTFALTATRGSNPIAGQVVALTTDFGTLGVNQVTTGANGTATFTISNVPHNPGTAHITASFTTNIPAGTVQDDVSPNRQRIMVGTSVNSPVTANATAAWSDIPTAVTLSSFDARAVGVPALNIIAIAGGACCLGLILAGARRLRRRN